MQKDSGQTSSPASIFIHVHSLGNTVFIVIEKVPVFTIDVTADTIIINGVTHASGNSPFANGAAAETALVALFRDTNTGSGGSGLNGDGTYTPDVTTHYISSATSLMNADKLLDAQLFTDTGNIASNTSSIATKQTSLTPTAVLTGSYTAQPNDFVLVDASGGNVPIALANSPADKSRIGIKQIAVSGSFTTTFTCGGIDVINKAGGSTSGTLTLLNQAVMLQYDATHHIWVVTGDDLSLSTLDARFSPIITDTRTSLFLGAMNSTARDAIATPTAGSIIFNTTTSILEKYEDTTWTWMPVSSADTLWNSKYGFDYFRNFHTVNNDGVTSVSTVNGGAVSSSQAQAGFTAEMASTCGLYTSTATNGRAAIISSTGTIIFGSGLTMMEARIYILNLSNSTDRFILYSGFSNNTTGVDPINGMGIFYDEGAISAGSTASANWQLSVSNNNTRTIVATSVAVAASTWYKLRVEVNAAGTAVRFYINDVYVNPSGDITTNIPTGQTRASGLNIFMHKNAGTTSRGTLLNTVRLRQKYTTARA